MSDTQLAPNLPKWMLDHVDRYLKSGGTDGHMYSIKLPGVPERTVPSLLLTTTGRKSGQKYLFPLFYGRAANDGYFVIASKGGAPEHPGWFRNLLAHPEVEIQVGTAKMKAKARIAEGAERASLWDQAVGIWPPFADYQVKAASRQIPVVVLDPIR